MSDESTMDSRLLAGTDIDPAEPGLVVGVHRGGELIAWAAAGRASLEHAVPIDAETNFDVASVSKQFTVGTVLALAHQGLLSLTDDLRRHIPELSLRAPVTLEDCVRHTAGLRDYLGIIDTFGLSLPAVGTMPKVTAALALHTDVDYPPGTDHHYSNSGYVLLAEVVQRVTGRPFAEVVAESLLRPLGMTNSRIRDLVGIVVPRKAACYEQTPSGWLREDSHEALVGDGALITSVTDLARWTGFLTGSGSTAGAVPAEVRAALLAMPRTGYRYGRGLVHGTFAGLRAVRHGGSMYHFRSHLVVLPDDDWAVAIMANRPDLPVTDIASAALRTAMESAGVSVHPRPRPVADDGSARAAAGRWLDRERDQVLTVEAGADGSLVVQEETLTFRGDRHWSNEDEQLTLDLADHTLTMTEDYAGPSRYERIEPVDAAADLIATGVYVSAETGVRLSVEPAAESGWQLRIGELDPKPLIPLAVADGDLIAQAGENVARWTVGEQVDRILLTGDGFRRLAFDR